MRVSVLSHTYAVAANRGKIAALSGLCGGHCQLITPQRWVDTLHYVDAAGGGARHVVLPARLAGKGELYWMPPLRILVAVEHFAPDLLHVEEEPFSVTAVCCALIAQRLGVPFTLFTSENTPRRLPPPFGAIGRFVLGRAAHVIAGSTEGARLLPGWGFCGPVSVMPQLGVPLPPATARRVTHDDFRIGYVGRLVPEKGVSLILEALATLGEGTLRVVGKGPEEDHLRRQACGLGVESRVTFAGGVPHARVAEEMAGLDVLVLPSLTTRRWKEQFGHVLVEAMSAGVPVIGSSSGAIPEVIGDAGLVFREGCSDDLARALRRLRESASLREQLAAAGRVRVLAEFTDEWVAYRTFAVWQSVLGRDRCLPGLEEAPRIGGREESSWTLDKASLHD